MLIRRKELIHSFSKEQMIGHSSLVDLNLQMVATLSIGGLKLVEIMLLQNTLAAMSLLHMLPSIKLIKIKFRTHLESTINRREGNQMLN